MLLTPHVLVGTVIGMTIQNPIIAVPLSIGAHLLGDLVPHWDFYSHTSKEQKLRGWRPIAVMADYGLAIAIGVFFTLNALWVIKNPGMAVNVFLCGIGSVLPDALEAPHIYMTHEPAITKFVYSIQHRLQFQAKPPWGIISQLIVCGAALLVIANLVK
jgi:hypothetical protein